MPSEVTSLVGSQHRVLEVCLDTVRTVKLWGSYSTEPVTCEAHPFFFQVKESRRVLIPLLVWDRTIVESGLHHQQSNYVSLYFCEHV
ncbi:hypothetical protein Taro_042242 [Colocasia esculenta]|uniref:Uncharacterized protein n=1 Tax=Colocasia esculenta TaxID=4460 RepID=A0A843WDG3_COLES|nr:hypothetical protein [Colocasia esculenta]